MKNRFDGGNAIVEAFHKLGVEYILSSPGTEWAPVWEAMADQILMAPSAVLGPVDPQIGQQPAASIIAAVLSYAAFAAIGRRLSVLETNIAQTAGAAARAEPAEVLRVGVRHAERQGSVGLESRRAPRLAELHGRQRQHGLDGAALLRIESG